MIALPRMAAITGTGLVTALSSDITNFFSLLCSKKTAIGDVKRFSSALRYSNRGAELNDGEITTAAARWALQASRAALLQAGWNSVKPAHDLAVVFGTTAGEAERTKLAFQLLDRLYDDPLPLDDLLWYRQDTLTETLCDALDVHGHRITLSNACATGIFAIDYAIDLLASGEAKAVLVCAVDILSEFNHSALRALRLLSSDFIRPFDAYRSGTLLGDGAGALVLEPLDIDKQRALGYIHGVAVSCDAYDLAGHNPDGSGMARSMDQALECAGLSTRKIAYLNAHGTGTRKNDESELRAINKVFCNDTSDLVIGSTKAACGHTGAASGIIETIISLVAGIRGVAPPTLFHTQLDAGATANGIIQDASAPLPTDLVMSNSFSFGGGNGTIIVSPRYPTVEKPLPTHPRRRAVISGIGVCTMEDWEADELRAAMRVSERPDYSRYRTKHRFFGSDDFTLVALTAAKHALEMAELADDHYPSASMGIVFGTCYGSAATNQECYEALASGMQDRITPFMSVNSGFNVAGDALAVEFGAQAFSLTVTAGELASLHSLAIAAERVQNNRAEAVLSVGSEILIEPFVRATQKRRGIEGSTQQLSAGSICHVVESLDSALARKASPLFELCSWKFTRLPSAATSQTLFALLWQHLQAYGSLTGDLQLILSCDRAPLSEEQFLSRALEQLACATHADWFALEKEINDCGGLVGAFAVAKAYQHLKKSDGCNYILVCCRDLFNGLGLVLLRAWSGGAPSVD